MKQIYKYTKHIFRDALMCNTTFDIGFRTKSRIRILTLKK